MTGRRILFGTFGSAGDLFPIVPLVQRLQAEGHEVRAATPRALGLYLRAIGVPTIALGDGTEMRVVSDPTIFTTADDGWESWRQTVEHYILPTAVDDVAIVRKVIADWRPDVVVVTSLALVVRLAALAEGVPVVDVTIYPQHAGADEAMDAMFEHPVVAEVLGAHRDAHRAKVAWGVPADVLLHDPVLLGASPDAAAAVGFPYWDGIPCTPRDAEAMAEWAGGAGRRMLVTLGSFIGVARRDVWHAAAEVTAAHDLRTAFVGARGSWAEEEFGDDPRITCVGYVPLSRWADQADVVVHHGGIGTTFAAIRAGRPALVVPQAFDQGANARMVEAAGLGVEARPGAMAAQIDGLLADAGARARVTAAGAALIDPDDAVAAALGPVLAPVPVS